MRSGQRIHPTAVIGSSVQLPDDVIIGPYAIIEDGVEIGPGCIVGPFVHIRSGVQLERAIGFTPVASSVMIPKI